VVPLCLIRIRLLFGRPNFSTGPPPCAVTHFLTVSAWTFTRVSSLMVIVPRPT
jgi:hypothetical protein